MKRIYVSAPLLSGNERKYVLDCIDSTWISSHGKYIGEFEKSFATFCGAKHAIAVNNGTTALHVALVALGLKPGDEVLVPTVTYIATANAVRYCGATPVLVDVCRETMNLDPAELEAKLTPRTKGIIPVHLYGHPAEMGPIMAFARKHGLFVLEDAAEAHGAEYKGTKVGTIGDCAIFSFFGNKIVTTGEGGMVTTESDELAERLRLFKGQGMDPHRRYWFQVVGYNYRMTNIQAAIGLAQMETIDKALAYRNDIARWYGEFLSPFADVLSLPKQQSWAKQVYWMYVVFIKDGDATRRDAITTAMDKDGIETRPVFYPMHIMPPYYENTSYPVADKWAQRGINLPTHLLLKKDDVRTVCDSLVRAIMAMK